MPYVHEQTEYEIKKEWSLLDLQSRLKYDEWEDCRQRGVVRRLLLEHPEDRRAFLATEFDHGRTTVLPLSPGVAFNFTQPQERQVSDKSSPLAAYMARKAEEAQKAKMSVKAEGGISDILKKGVRVSGAQAKGAISDGHGEVQAGGASATASPKAQSSGGAEAAQISPEEIADRLMALEEKVILMPKGKERDIVQKLIDQNKLIDAEKCFELYGRTEVVQNEGTGPNSNSSDASSQSEPTGAPSNHFPPSINSTWPKLAESRDTMFALYINFDPIFSRFRFVQMGSDGVVKDLPTLDEDRWRL